MLSTRIKNLIAYSVCLLVVFVLLSTIPATAQNGPTVEGTAGASVYRQGGADYTELKELDRLRYENKILAISNLELQRQRILAEGQRQTSEFTAWKAELYKEYDLTPEDWVLNEERNPARFERRKKP